MLLGDITKDMEREYRHEALNAPHGERISLDEAERIEVAKRVANPWHYRGPSEEEKKAMGDFFERQALAKEAGEDLDDEDEDEEDEEE